MFLFPKHRKSSLKLTVLLSGIIACPLVLNAPNAWAVDLLDFSKVTAERFKTEGEAEVSIVQNGGTSVVEAKFPGGKGYPGFDFPKPEGGWKTAETAGIMVDVTNKGTAGINLAMRVDEISWQKNNSESLWIKAGETKTLKVTFGQTHGNPGYKMDPAKVSNVKIFAIDPKETAVQLANLRTFGTGAAVAVAPATAAANTTAATSTPGVLFDISKVTADAFTTQDNTVVKIVEAGGAKGISAEFPAMSGYPAFDFPMPAGGWGTAGSSGVQVELTNTGTTSLNVAMRLDEKGNWQKNNSESVSLKAGETKTLKVTYGKSYGGNPGYPLQADKVGNIKIFANNPKQGGTVLVKNLKTFGAGEAAPSVASTGGGTAGATSNLKSPPISGELVVVDAKTDAAKFETQNSTATVENGALKVVFNGGNGYPNVKFPMPPGGWNLSAFGGVQVDITNPGATDVIALMRVDNPGDWKKNPWNTEKLRIKAGQTTTMKMIFGEQNGAPGYPLDSNQITSIQVFLENPKEERTLIFNNLKAYGSPRPKASNLSFSTPEDRNKPVTPPAWLGSKPPVDGNWVQTLNENFDGPKLNDKIWRERTWWHGMLAGQTQRYASSQHIFEDGLLKMKTEKKPGYQWDDPKLHDNNGKTLPQLNYVTGHILSYDKWTQLYGYFEARVKLPTTRGLWPAFWMMPDRGPAAGPEGWKRESTENGGMEIDILEHLTEWGPGRNNVAVHWDGYGDRHKSWGTSDIYFGPTPDGWHTFGVLWEPGKLTWFVDGVKKSEFAHERVGSIPAYLLLNVQMGGWATKDVDEAKLPDYYQIDYVRAWQLKDRIK